VSVVDLVHQLLGCSWGHVVRTADDEQPCVDAAVRIVIVHDGPFAKDLRLCRRHLERVLAETTQRSTEP
jgi:hypothetical protein